MKTKIALFVTGVVAVTFLLIDRPFAVMEKAVSPKPEILVPLNLECVVTIENQAWMETLYPHAPGPPSGFLPDYTIQGKLLRLGPDWVVIGEGSYENWISRDRIINIRASR
jgi:hypothetical protein